MPEKPRRKTAQRRRAQAPSSSSSSNSPSGDSLWSKHGDGIGYNQLEKFWNSLSVKRRQELLKIAKSTLFERARKSVYCSRCIGLVRVAFSQITGCEESVQQGGAGSHHPDNPLWGNLTKTRDGGLTFADCSTSLSELQTVFFEACKRERDRELRYPHACGGGGQGCGRGHGTREACALHTEKISVDILVGFWSALPEENQRSLLTMREDDFMERLKSRFARMKSCTHCRRNVVREFKELKELKRTRKQSCCTSWYCVADTAFHCKVTDNSIEIDWQQSFTEDAEMFVYFEWAVGEKEGQTDILAFENVGLSRSARADDLVLKKIDTCYVTLRGWKTDGECTELSLEAHAVELEACIHDSLVISDGCVSIERGLDIKRLFDHADEVVDEDEDDEPVEKDKNGVNGDSSRGQRHAGTPELARKFLLDAVTIIFKEQVEKVYKEGAARDSAWSILVCLATTLLEERLHAACKETVALEKQMKLLEEEEAEKRVEEGRKERRRKEKERKLKRKERINNSQEMDHHPVKKDSESDETPVVEEEDNPTEEVPIPTVSADDSPEEVTASDSPEEVTVTDSRKEVTVTDRELNDSHTGVTSYYRAKTETRAVNKSLSKPSIQMKKSNNQDYYQVKKVQSGSISYTRDWHQVKKVWEPRKSSSSSVEVIERDHLKVSNAHIKPVVSSPRSSTPQWLPVERKSGDLQGDSAKGIAPPADLTNFPQLNRGSSKCRDLPAKSISPTEALETTKGDAHLAPHDSLKQQNGVGNGGLKWKKIVKPNGGFESQKEGDGGFSFFYYPVPCSGNMWNFLPRHEDESCSVRLPEEVKRAVGCMKVYKLF